MGDTTGDGFTDALDIQQLLADADPEIRTQTARTLGDSKLPGMPDVLPLLFDTEPRVRLQATLALARRGQALSTFKQSAVSALYMFLNDNADHDTDHDQKCFIAVTSCCRERCYALAALPFANRLRMRASSV